MKSKLDICERLTQSAGITTCFVPIASATKEQIDAAIKKIYDDRNDACLDIESLRKKVRVLREDKEAKTDYEYWSMSRGDRDDG